jgi:hypothetical protein
MGSPVDNARPTYDEPMKWTHAQSIKVITRADGKAEIHILKRDDGLYEYRGFAEINDDGDVYWAETAMSGLHDSAEHAERDAIDEVHWLRQLSRMNET